MARAGPSKVARSPSPVCYGLAPEAFDLCTRASVMRIEHPAPAPVAESRGVPRRIDDVCE
jgi:hypothetical protein